MDQLRLLSGDVAARQLEKGVRAGRIFRNAADRLRDRRDTGGVGSADAAMAPQTARFAAVIAELDVFAGALPDAVGA